MLVETPENRAPVGASTEMIVAADGVKLRAAWWRAGAGKPRGTVCLFPGRSEFIEKYYETIRDLRARGFAVAILDWRGQGGSQRLARDPRLGHVGSFDEYHRDLDVFMTQIAFAECPPPYYALAHSMGGAILFDRLAARPTWFDRLVATSPMIGLPGVRFRERFLVKLLWGIGMGRMLTPGFPRSPVATRPFEGNAVTTDRARYEAGASIARAEPKIALGGPTIGWVKSAFDIMDTLRDPDFGQNWRTPALIIASGYDTVVSTEDAERLGKRLRATSVCVIPGARHELMMEADAIRAQFFAAFDAFVPGSH